MKQSIYLILFSALVLVSCKEDEPEVVQLSPEESAEIVSSSVTTDIVGVTFDLTRISGEINTDGGRLDAANSISCGQLLDTAVSVNYESQFVTFNFSASYSVELVCTERGAPTELTASFLSQGNYDGQRVTAEGETGGNLSLTGFGFSNVAYDLSGSMNRDYLIVQKEGEQNGYNSESDIQLQSILIDKENLQIAGGVALYNVSGTRVNGEAFSFTATVTFNGDQTATIVTNNREFVVDLITGQLLQ
jgi:hypothetical protein